MVALLTAYLLELLLEAIDAWVFKRQARFRGGFLPLMNFLLPAHITGMVISMLLYSNARLLPFAFASAVAVASKAIFIAPVNGSRRHFLNPSNTGMAITLLIFPTISAVLPWQFTKNLGGWMSWILPLIVVCTGTFLNARFTKRLPLIASWVIAFSIQGLMRSIILETPLNAALAPMTGVVFVLFTFYMITDPATTPDDFRGQVIFGAAVAAVYGALVALHIGFGLFFALLVVCAARGLSLYALGRRTTRSIQFTSKEAL